MVRRNGTSRITEPRGVGRVRKGLIVPASVERARAANPRAEITRHRECDECRETHLEVWCQCHKRWELAGTEGEAGHA